MSRVKFKWEFHLEEENTRLRVDLNGGMNTSFDLRSPLASFYISNKLAEILRYQFDVGNKTEIPPLDTRLLFEAIQIAEKNLLEHKEMESIQEKFRKMAREEHLNKK